MQNKSFKFTCILVSYKTQYTVNAVRLFMWHCSKKELGYVGNMMANFVIIKNWIVYYVDYL